MRRIVIRRASDIVSFDEAEKARREQEEKDAKAAEVRLAAVKKAARVRQADSQLEMAYRCLESVELLSRWEEDFLDSITIRLEGGGTLSEKQAAVLERIYHKITFEDKTKPVRRGYREDDDY